MKTLKLALGLLLATGAAALLPSSVHAQGAYGGAYGGGGYGTGNQSAAAEARKAINEAQAEVRRIQADMNKIKARVAAKFEGKEEWETAQKNLKAAEAAYASATKKATAALQASAEYKAAKEKQIKSEAVLNQPKSAKSNPKDLEKAQQDRLDAGLAIRKLETDALQNDPKVVETKAALADARKAWEALQDELKEALQQDETYVAAEQELQTAQANVEQMKASAAQTAASERQARRQQQESMRQSGRSGRPGRGAYGG